MKLGYYFHVPAISKGQEILTPGFQSVFIDSLAPYCEKLICFLHSPRPDEEYQCNRAIQSKNVELVNIGLHSSVPDRIIHSRRYTAPLKERLPDLDILLLRGPSPLLPALAHEAGELPLALLLVSDYLAGIDDLPQPRWRKEAIRAWSWWNARQQLQIAKNNLTFVNSHLLYEKLSGSVNSLVETRTTTLEKKDFTFRDDTCNRRPIRLLFVGRMDRTKGLLDVLEAVHLLVDEGEDIIFDLVGPPEKNDPIVADMQKLAAAYGIHDRIVFHGYQSLGPALFSFYRQADVYVIASQASEGFPRTIWEAFSQGTPVIATGVGSIPYYLQDEYHALIAPPKYPAELARLIKRMISEPDLRKRLIANGYRLAEENTLDRRAKEMIVELEKWLAQKQSTINR